jgi:signal peptide peptidase SppA
MQRGSMMGNLSASSGTSIQQFTQQFRQALADPAIKAIVLDVDSPGGTTAGCEELAAEILAARGKKPIIAVANCQMASAAFYIAAGADEIVASPSALVGSIGVYAAIRDESEALQKAGIKITLCTYGENKAEGNSSLPVTAKAIGHLQQLVDAAGGMFDAHVAKARGVSGATVRSTYGQGRMFDAQHAKQLGLIDRVESFDQTLARLGVNASAPARQSLQSAAVTEISAAAADPDATSCQCTCAPCVAGDCAGCTTDDCDAEGCDCEALQSSAKAAAQLSLHSAAVRRQALIAAI